MTSNQIPPEVHLDNKTLKGDEITDAFACYFEDKVNKITRDCKVDDNMYNGQRMANVGNENFMDEIKVKKVLSVLKI